MEEGGWRRVEAPEREPGAGDVLHCLVRRKVPLFRLVELNTRFARRGRLSSSKYLRGLFRLREYAAERAGERHSTRARAKGT